MSRWPGDPARAMKPFDSERHGFVLGEGSAFLVLEELSHALGRNARIYCEVLSHGQACDAYNMVALHPGGRGTIQAIERALIAGRINAHTIDWINAHGSATASNDVIESNAIRTAFGSAADTLAVSATKPVTGHLVGATAAIEAVICALAIDKGCVPRPTWRSPTRIAGSTSSAARPATCPCGTCSTSTPASEARPRPSSSENSAASGP